MTFHPLQALRALVRPGDPGHIEALSASERLVLVALTSYADEDGRGWPSLSTLAEGTGIGRSTVKRTLASLEARRLIRREQRPLPQTTMYTLTLPSPDRPRESLGPERAYIKEDQIGPERAPDRPRAGPEVLKEVPTTPNSTPAAEAVREFCGVVGTPFELTRDTPESWVRRMEEEHPGIDVEARVRRAIEWWDSALSTGKRKKCRAPSQALRAFLRDPPGRNGRPAQPSAPDAGVTYRRLR